MHFLNTAFFACLTGKQTLLDFFGWWIIFYFYTHCTFFLIHCQSCWICLVLVYFCCRRLFICFCNFLPMLKQDPLSSWLTLSHEYFHSGFVEQALFKFTFTCNHYLHMEVFVCVIYTCVHVCTCERVLVHICVSAKGGHQAFLRTIYSLKNGGSLILSGAHWFH